MGITEAAGIFAVQFLLGGVEQVFMVVGSHAQRNQACHVLASALVGFWRKRACLAEWGGGHQISEVAGIYAARLLPDLGSKTQPSARTAHTRSRAARVRARVRASTRARERASARAHEQSVCVALAACREQLAAAGAATIR